MQRIAAFWNKGLVGKATIVLIGLVVVCCIFGALTGRGGSQPTQAGATPAPAAVSADATAVAPEPTSAPSAPTDTPAPTPTSSPIPATPTPVPPIELSGNGKTVTDPFTPPSPVSRVTFTHNGARNFAVTLYVDNQMTDLLVNTIGSYAGTRPILSTGETYLEIDADGDWTATIEAVPQDDTYTSGAKGSGDFVSPLFAVESGSVPFAFTHTGQRNFAVFVRCAGGMDLVANEIGSTEGQTVVRFSEGPCLWDVQADGDWSLMPR